MRYKIIILLFMFFLQGVSAQENINTQLKVNDIVSLFSASSLQWAIPVSSSEKVNLQWYERKTSFAEKEGIRTFVGYEGDLFVATLSISKDGNNISGDFTWKENEWKITTTNDGYLSTYKEHSEGECGGCHNGHCGTHSDKKPLRGRLTARPEKIIRKISTDNVLRVFRLAVLVDKHYYNRYYGSKDAVKSFWSRLETKLNEHYTREIGIKFQIVDRDELIISDSKEAIFDGKRSAAIIDGASAKIDELIGNESYDAGIVIARNSDTSIGGLATAGSIRSSKSKARAMANNDMHIITHELGHLFGSVHTFSTGGSSSYMTEPGKGQSIMSYGHPVDFFSLPSIYYIRKKILEIQHKVAEIQTTNQAPIINTSKLKEEYILPKETFFQFTVDATDPDNDPLLYAFHQADINLSNAEFESEKSTNKNIKAFYNHWQIGNFVKKQYNFSSGKAYTFWLGVNDTKNTFDERLNHSTRYDMYETKVKFVEGKPFKITNFQSKKYKTGEKVNLTWQVDDLLKDYKVRVLLSDDFGQTFKHILVPETENDGNCDIIMPDTSIGRKVHYEANGVPIFHSGLGLIKIEVLDHIAFALTDNDIATGKGGFEIEASAITFTKTPTKYLKVSDENNIPNEPIEAVSTCTANGSSPLTLKKEEVKNENFVTRTWIATDDCGNTSSFVQHIEIEKTTTPPPPPADLVFTKTPTAFLSVSCDAIPNADNSQFETSGCNSVIITHQDTRKGDNCNYTIERVYTATGCSQSLIFTQTISVRDDKAPTFNESLPADVSVEENNIPTQETLTATDNCSANIEVIKSKEERQEGENKVIIYKWEASDECGNKVFHEQKVTIKKSSKPTPPTGGVQPPTGIEPTKEMIVYNGVSTESGSENYLKFEPIENYKNLQIEIFNELGQKVYESKNYQKNGEVFRGYANVKGVFRKGKRLPTGTYFYILKYQDITGKSNTKQGYLFVR
ncbi:reprolysin-like metallopeptidase [Capnocytophaga cynodegmi]|uniref:reprolysin-like metallopeptidase n=3 Tax=Capnocytophaga cynodegmi TaxID=28189 RepID=UPI000371B2DD|nr:M12 family metallo-peptidase [Capnocytophaga cynodegmi]